MDERWFLNLIAGRPVPGGWLLRPVLRVASWGYGAAIRFRNLLFDRGLRKAGGPYVPVISVGNLTTGGTGKTPVVAWVVEQLQTQGRKPGIISRGYRALEDGHNDEARVLELLCPGVPHVQNRDRITAARQIVEQHGCDAIVADDAFQHRRLRRGLDVVLIDATNPWGYGALLPRGLLREPRSGLRRAGQIIVTRADQVSDAALDQIWSEVRRWRPDAPRIEIMFEPAGLVASGGVSVDMATLAGGPVVGFCGIGNPDSFRLTLESLHLTIAAFQAFPDHHHYSQADMQRLTDLSRSHTIPGAAPVLLTTLKDLVKLDPGHMPDVRVLAVSQRVRVLRGLERVTRPIRNLAAAPGVPGSTGSVDMAAQPDEVTGVEPPASPDRGGT